MRSVYLKASSLGAPACSARPVGGVGGSARRGRTRGRGRRAHLLHKVQDLVREGRVGERESLGVRLSLHEGRGGATRWGQRSSSGDEAGERPEAGTGRVGQSGGRTIVVVVGLRAHTEITARGERWRRSEGDGRPSSSSSSALDSSHVRRNTRLLRCNAGTSSLQGIRQLEDGPQALRKSRRSLHGSRFSSSTGAASLAAPSLPAPPTSAVFCSTFCSLAAPAESPSSSLAGSTPVSGGGGKQVGSASR